MDEPWRVKQRQADDHIARFGAACAGYLSEASVGLRQEVNPVRGIVRVRLHATSNPPVALGAMIGDVLHNLRSSLDAVAWAACQQVGIPRNQERRIFFPISSDPNRWHEESRRCLPMLPAEKVEVFRALQPWWWSEIARDHGVSVPPDSARNHPLRQLHDLARIDRHRVPHPVLARAGHSWLGHADGVVVSLDLYRPGEAQIGDVVVEWRVNPPSAASDVHPDGEVILALTDGTNEYPPPSAVDQLRSMQRAVVEATRRIEVDVLELVSRVDLDALAELAREAQAAAIELESLIASPHVIDNSYIERYSVARAAEEASRAAHIRLWEELFG